MSRPGSYRYPFERLVLVGTLVLTVLVVLLGSTSTLGGILLLLTLALAWRIFTVSRTKRALRARARPVAELPEVAAVVERCRARLGLEEEVEVLVLDQPHLNALATGLDAPYVVVLFSGLIEALDPDELASAIGHELGHVQLGHTWMLGLLGQAGTATWGMGWLGWILRRLLFRFWMRRTEFSADRAGLIASGSLEASISTLLKVSLPRAHWGRIDPARAAAWYREHDATAELRSLVSTHPSLSERLDELVAFHDSGASKVAV